MQDKNTPYGLCECGCGQATWIPRSTDAKNGYVAGQPVRWARGHNRHPVPIADRFWQKVEKTDTCWLWTGAQSSTGYGRVSVDGILRLPHRVAYELLVGPIGEGLTLDHLCKTPLCCNPAHLEPVTMRENTLRGSGLSAEYARRTHCDRGHLFDEANTAYPREGGRRCRACSRERARARCGDREGDV